MFLPVGSLGANRPGEWSGGAEVQQRACWCRRVLPLPLWSAPMALPPCHLPEPRKHTTSVPGAVWVPSARGQGGSLQLINTARWRESLSLEPWTNWGASASFPVALGHSSQTRVQALRAPLPKSANLQNNEE